MSVQPSSLSPPAPAPASFGELPAPVRERLREASLVRAFAPGAFIQGRETGPIGLSVVVSGGVRFANTSADGALADLADLGPGECFGEIPLLSGRPPAYDAYAVGATQLAITPASRFAALMASDPVLATAFAGLLATRLHDVFAVFDDLRVLRPTARAAKYLLWATRLEAPSVAVDQSRLASRLGVSRVTLGKALRAFVDADAVQTGYRRLTVLDRERLAAFIPEGEGG